MLNETEARQAVPMGHMRYVLGISLVLVIVAFAVIYLTYFRWVEEGHEASGSLVRDLRKDHAAQEHVHGLAIG